MSLFDLLGRALLGFVVAYLMFWVSWFWLHLDSLVYLVFTKDKKFKPVPPAGSFYFIFVLRGKLFLDDAH